MHIHRQVRGFKKMWQRIFGRADYIQAISKYLADWAKSEGATCPIEVVPNGVDLNKFKIQSAKIKITNQNSKIRIITTSRLVEKNGVDVLIRASSYLKVIIPDTRFLIQIVGGGKEENALKKLTRDLKVDDVVEFTGEITPERIPEYLQQADIFVRPSRSEGLGSSFLEAMAAGLPVIGTAVGGITDFLVDYNAKNTEQSANDANGLFVEKDNPKDLAQKIGFLLERADLREELGENGRRLIEEKYNWAQIANQMNRIFQKLIA